MCNRLYTFLEQTVLIYSFKLGCRQKDLTTHALINLTALIRKQFYDGNYDCHIFVDFQKTLNIVDHEIHGQN